ncbi:glutamine--fructose-6-phosphate transaminase (isomerizing) [Oryzibacter oryziterrae]|uniref:glutamine--fructose-6-phosphate transaminase (isomerizing) n=1 Tax=Oryzibacter oryziterrae TaxID=2766474 RepID=UPI001F02687C|nr:glutamine--fructose-6-phosphate transaminase (isomerizing) [Oryzibacter oryziterrae]
MCGIIGIVGCSPVADRLADSLKRLEYRGYDSAGIATLEASGAIARLRAEGKLVNLQALIDKAPPLGTVGIGHTRWATHGVPSERNAHPHATAQVAVVHNGIIENFRELREEMEGLGRHFESDTDTEVVAHLVSQAVEAGASPVDAVASVLPRLKGAFALALLFRGRDDILIGARRGSPLAIGYGKGEMFLGSDAMALAPFTSSVAYLEDGDWVVITHEGATIRDETGEVVARAVTRSNASALIVDKGNHRHFMAKEIHEQPEVVGHTLARYVDFTSGRIRLPADSDFSFAKVRRLVISACGTAYYAGLTAKYWFERYAGLPVDIDIASEFRYREAPLDPDDVSLFVSQSGETADTLAALRYCKAAGQKVAAVVNVMESTIARESDVVFPTLAGPEIGVASTKAFTCQLTALLCLAIAAGRQRGVLDDDGERSLVQALIEIPRIMAEALKVEHQIEGLAKSLSKVRHALYLGRGTNFPLALEGALKLKEISYIHAEGYAAGELKHGPIALIDETMPVIVIAPHDQIFEKTVSNMQEVAARGGRIILMTDTRGAGASGLEPAETIILPDMPAAIAPLAYAIPVQLLAYHTAVFIGTDVDQPRNLAKSVTVE